MNDMTTLMLNNTSNLASSAYTQPSSLNQAQNKIGFSPTVQQNPQQQPS